MSAFGLPPATHSVERPSIGIFAPSSPFARDRFERGLRLLTSRGFPCHVHPQVEERFGFLAGCDDARLAALDELLEDDRVDVLMAARGGYGAHRLLERLDLQRIQRAGKRIVGFSDVTALHAAAQHVGVSTIHGPVVTQHEDLRASDLEQLERVLSGEPVDLHYCADGPVIRAGRSEGRLVGGCLSVITPLVGSGLLEWSDGVILLLEDVEEAPYRIDRMLTHLRLSGLLHHVRGIAAGDFVRCLPPEPPRPGEQTVEDVLRDRLGDLGIPVLTGFPFGHGTRNEAVPLGTHATLDADSRTLVVHREL